MTTEAGKRLLAELHESPLRGAWYARDVVALRLPAIEAEAAAAERERLYVVIHVAQDVVRDAGTDRWPVNLDRLRMALDEIGELPVDPEATP